MLIHVARELAAISGDISDLALTLPHFYRYLRGVLTMADRMTDIVPRYPFGWPLGPLQPLPLTSSS